MSTIHVRAQNKENKSISVVFHAVVPTGNNFAGVPWNQCIRESMNPQPVLAESELQAVENAQIVNGDVLESVQTVIFSARELTNSERWIEIHAVYAARTAKMLAELAVKLNFWGFKS